MSAVLRKSFAAGAVALTLVAAITTTSAPASAREGGAIAAGVIGGLALGAIAGSAAANANNGGYGYPAYAPPVRDYGGGCYFTREPVYDEDGNIIGRHRVRVCE